MLSPHRSVIERRVGGGAGFHGVKSSNPSKPVWMVALEERAGNDRAGLLDSFGKIGFEVLGKARARVVFNGISAQFDDLKIGQMRGRFGPRVRDHRRLRRR